MLKIAEFALLRSGKQCGNGFGNKKWCRFWQEYLQYDLQVFLILDDRLKSTTPTLRARNSTWFPAPYKSFNVEISDSFVMIQCDYLDRTTCRLIEEKCNFVSEKGCRLKELYRHIAPCRDNHPITESVKNKMWLGVGNSEGIRKRWISYNRSKTGGRQMFARPLEDSLVDELRNTLPTLDVIARKKIEPFGLDLRIDCRIKSQDKDKVQTLISLKVTADPLSFRESFAFAYFSKMWFGQKNVRFYLVAVSSMISIRARQVAAPFVDGDYYLSPVNDEPYVDDLFAKLKTCYMNNK